MVVVVPLYNGTTKDCRGFTSFLLMESMVLSIEDSRHAVTTNTIEDKADHPDADTKVDISKINTGTDPCAESASKFKDSDTNVETVITVLERKTVMMPVTNGNIFFYPHWYRNISR